MFHNKLLRRSLALTIALALWLSSYIPIAAEEEIRLSFLARDIYVNGVLIHNYQLNDPIVIREGQTYLPLTASLGAALGIQVRMDETGRLILLQPVAPSGKTVKEADMACNLEDRTGTKAEEYKVAVVRSFDNGDVTALAAKWRQILDPVIWSLSGLLRAVSAQEAASEPEAEILKLNEGEILFVGQVPYIPLAALRSSAMLSWDAHFDQLTGLYISTDASVPAESYYSETNASYIRGRAAYIRGVRPELSLYQSYFYEYLFRHEATVYGVDQELLMAVARTESAFQAGIVATFGSVGIMQIMPRTAAAYGITYEQLKDVHINLEFGTRYIRDRLWMFGGDVIKALSAYNQGVLTVKKGDYRTGYAEKCLYNKSVLEGWLSTRNYAPAFETRLATDVVRASASEAD